jgi:thioredoxin 1
MEMEKKAELKRLSKSSFDETVGSGVTLVDFNAPWCGPCRAQEPILEALAHDLGGSLSFASCNVDENQERAVSLGIRNIPTLILFKEGREVARLTGVQSRESLLELIQEGLQE